MSKNITGRDDYIISQGLAIAIPFLLLYSPSVSNTKDLMTIFREKFSPEDLGGILEKPVEEAIYYMLNKLRERQVVKAGNPTFQEKQISVYLDRLDEYLPPRFAREWRGEELH
jgi:hypothetical protein